MITPDSLLRGVVSSIIVSIFLLDAPLSFGRVESQREYFDAPFVLNDSACLIRLSPQADFYVIDVRGAMDGIGERPGQAPNYWGIDLLAPEDSIRLVLRHGNSSFGDLFDQRQSILTLGHGDEIVWSQDVSAFESASGDYNTLQLRLDIRENSMQVRGGGKRMTDIVVLDLAIHGRPGNAKVWSKGPLTVASLSVETSCAPQKTLMTDWTAESLKEHFDRSDDPVEGFWQYLDRENNLQYARLGGRYRLAVVKNADKGVYDIIYVGGAETLSDQWYPMMLKGKLNPTIFVDHYDLEWIDSTFEPMKYDIHAQITDGAILALSFPLLKTTIRFSKVRLK